MNRLALVLALLASACTAASEPEAVEDPGRLVFTDADGGISIWDRGTGEITQIADPIDGTDVAQPIWSNTGQFVSWARLHSLGPDYVIHDLETGENEIVETANFPFYATWSTDDSSIVLLRNGPDTVAVELVEVATGESEVIDTGAPYYLSWNPEGDSYVAHIGDTDLSIVDPDGTVTSIGPTAGTYVAPFWTESGIVHANNSGLVLEDEGQQEPLLRLSAPTQFVVSPDGSRVAMQQLGDSPGQSIALEETPRPPSNVMLIYDFTAGEQTVVHDDLTLGFSWSPDGEHLLYHPLRDEELLAAVWPGDELTEPTAYLPSETYTRDLLPFFPQYVQSMSLWSPDSTAFVIVGEVDGRSGVWVREVPDGELEFVAEGTWAAWSR